MSSRKNKRNTLWSKRYPNEIEMSKKYINVIKD